MGSGVLSDQMGLNATLQLVQLLGQHVELKWLHIEKGLRGHLAPSVMVWDQSLESVRQVGLVHWEGAISPSPRAQVEH